MGSKSDWFESKLLDHVFGGTATPVGGTVWIGLWQTTLDDTSTGATAGEVSGGSYARVALVCNNTNWPAAAGGTIHNGAVVNFGTAGASWGTVNSWAALDAASTGNIFYWGTLGAPKVIASGDSASFAVSSIGISEA